MRAQAIIAVGAMALAALACDGRGQGATGPSAAAVSLRYVPLTQPASCTAPAVRECAGLCAHHYAPSNLQVSGSWGVETRLTACGDASCATLPAAPVGRELTVLLIDIAQCCRDCTAAVRQTVYANGTRLERFVAGEAGQSGGLAFEVDGNGVVRP